MPDRDEAPDLQKRAPRVQVQFSCEFYGRKIQGNGLVRNISTSGALIEDAEPLLISGTQIRMRFALGSDTVPVELTAEVARETEGGFAVRFDSMDARVRAVMHKLISRACERDDDDAPPTLLEFARPGRSG
jgi:hypothetical protein